MPNIVERTPYPEAGSARFPEGFSEAQLQSLVDWAEANKQWHTAFARRLAESLVEERVNSPEDETPEQFRERTGKALFLQQKYLDPIDVTQRAEQIAKEQAKGRRWENIKAEFTRQLQSQRANSFQRWLEEAGAFRFVEVATPEEEVRKWTASKTHNVWAGQTFLGHVTRYGREQTYSLKPSDGGSAWTRERGKEAAARELARYAFRKIREQEQTNHEVAGNILARVQEAREYHSVDNPYS